MPPLLKAVSTGVLVAGTASERIVSLWRRGKADDCCSQNSKQGGCVLMHCSHISRYLVNFPRAVCGAGVPSDCVCACTDHTTNVYLP